MPRPDYIGDMGLPCPSGVSDEQRRTVSYRCQRMQGVMNLYFWAMEWTLHDACGWQLGEESHNYNWTQQSLWTLRLEQLRDVPSAWETIVQTIGVRDRAGPDRRSGSVCVKDFRWNDVGTAFEVCPISCTGTRCLDPFHGDDPVTRIEFCGRSDCIPWHFLGNQMQRAFNALDACLKAEGVVWNGPPRFRHFVTGSELLRDVEIRDLDPLVALADLRHTRECFAESIETVFRAEVQREEIAREVLSPDFEAFARELVASKETQILSPEKLAELNAYLSHPLNSRRSIDASYGRLVLVRDFNLSLLAAGHLPPNGAKRPPKASKTGRRRRRKTEREPSVLTARQLEVFRIVGECKGNLSEAARRIGIDRKTLEEHYEAANRKMGIRAVKHHTRGLPKDRRGQDFVSNESDRRG